MPKTHDFLDYGLAHQFGALHFSMDSASSMKAIVAIHSTKLGPALGGCRFIHYANTEEAILDAMRLAQGMSYKAALANLPLGGGKAVIMKPETPFDRTSYMDAFGRFVETLKGQYITALDSGTVLTDMDRIYAHTPHVASLSAHQGDPAPSTAEGVYSGIEASVEFVLGKRSLKGLHIAIQGLGHVGYQLAKLLHTKGVKLTVADVNKEKTLEAKTQFGAKVVSHESIHRVPCDVFSPCALGGIINDQTLDEFQTPIIAGSANNQLAHHYHGQRLFEKGIAYAVDYVINSGGLIFAASKYLKTDEHKMHEQISNIGLTLTQIMTRAREASQPSNVIADLIAQEKLF